MYTKNKIVQNWQDEIDIKLYEKYLERLYHWEPINRLDELIELLDSLCGNERFLSFASNDEIGPDDEYNYKDKEIPILDAVLNEVTWNQYLPYIPQLTRRLITNLEIVSIFAMVQLSFVEYNKHYLTTEEDKIIKKSTIFQALTYHVEGYDNPKNKNPQHTTQYYQKHFHKLYRLNWQDKRTKQLDDRIRDLEGCIIGMNKLSFTFSRGFYKAAVYLMGCNALKNNRNSVNQEDVVIGYLTCYKIFFEDIRPTVYRLYEEAQKNNPTQEKETIMQKILYHIGL